MSRLLFCLAAAASIMPAAALADSGKNLNISTDSAGRDMQAQWELVHEVVPIGIDTFAKVRADHRAILANMAESILTIEAAGETPNVPFFCFTPGVSPETVWLFDAFAGKTQKFQGTDAGRWTNTFTDGGGIQRGSRITLRVSFPPDGVSLVDGTNPGFGENDTPNDLNASFDAGFGSRPVWKALFQSVFDDWSERTGVQYVFDVADDGAPFPATPGGTGRGDVRISGHVIDGAGAGVLAYNYGPNGGDMVIDTGNTTDSFAASSNNNFRLLRNTVSHEHGHGLGFAHVCPLNNAIVMEPIITTAFDHSAEDDIRHANRKYGDPREGASRNDSVANAALLGVLNIGTGNPGAFLSIDGNTDQDFYRVTTTAPRLVDITLDPQGTLYQEGAQGPTNGSDSTGCNASVLSNTNGAAVINLNLEVRASDGTTVLASSASASAGNNETIQDLFLPGNGTFYVRVYTNDAAGANGNSNTQVQMYALDFVSDSTGPNTLTLGTPQSTVEEGARVVLTAEPAGFDPPIFTWRKDGIPLSTEVESRLIIERVTQADAGSYTVEADDGTKALIVSEPVVVTVLPVGTLPVAGVVGLAGLAGMLSAAGATLIRRKK